MESLKAHKSKAEKAVQPKWRPKEATKNEQGAYCPHCGGEIKAGYAICPHCGRSLTPDKCSFCGAAMKPGAKFCTRCGQPREGAACPACGTLNARNFCRKCNAPLTPMAQKAMEAAKADPAFKAVQAKAEELAELHARIEELRNSGGESVAELSDADKALLDEYADILGSMGAYKPQPRPAHTSGSQTARRQYADGCAPSLDDIMKAYKEKAAEMNAALAALVPPPDYTPEQQRDYFSARKVIKSHVHADLSEYNPSLWCCNYCGALHNNPSECAEPQLGGTWIYQSPEEYIAKNPWATTTTISLEDA
ncbi:MAG: zinc ribbon domain-containing protein [Muribaculaceae bacterium]|nr:zinc ribbon domain-containing protein [Muribaculaceae bacterium]